MSASDGSGVWSARGIVIWLLPSLAGWAGVIWLPLAIAFWTLLALAVSILLAVLAIRGRWR